MFVFHSNNSGTDKRPSTTHDKDRSSPSQTRRSSLFPPSQDGSVNLQQAALFHGRSGSTNQPSEPLSLADQVFVVVDDAIIVTIVAPKVIFAKVLELTCV